MDSEWTDGRDTDEAARCTEMKCTLKIPIGDGVGGSRQQVEEHVGNDKSKRTSWGSVFTADKEFQINQVLRTRHKVRHKITVICFNDSSVRAQEQISEPSPRGRRKGKSAVGWDGERGGGVVSGGGGGYLADTHHIKLQAIMFLH